MMDPDRGIDSETAGRIAQDYLDRLDKWSFVVKVVTLDDAEIGSLPKIPGHVNLGNCWIVYGGGLVGCLPLLISDLILVSRDTGEVLFHGLVK